MNRSVWRPQKSVANDGSEECGRGSFHTSETQATDSNQLKAEKKKAKIPRRRTPTVDVSALFRASSTKHKSGKAAKARDTYDTIERQDGPTILECSSVVYRRDPQANNDNSSAGTNDLCGWRDREIECYKAAADRSATASNNQFDRSRLQTPAEGLRSNLQSRAGNYSRQSSSYGKRKESCYVFQHFYEPRHYIEHYRITQSYTTLNVPGLKRKMSRDCENGLLEKGEEFPPEPKVVEQDPDNYMQLGVKSYGQDADPYLQELVSRLGVRGLVRTPKPTPPSITKKTKPREDLVVRSNGKTSEEDCINEPLLPGNASNQDSSKTSRPAARSEGQGAANVELPKINAQSGHTGPLRVPPQRSKQSSNSVISVNKYLQVVTSQQQQNLPEENEDSEEKRDMEEEEEAQDCLPRVQSSGMSYLTDTPPAEKTVSTTHPESENTAEQPTHDKSTQGKGHLNGIRDAADKFNTPNTAAMKLAVQEQLMMLDNMQKERLISNKAHALGLTSRDWAKSAKAKRMLDNDKAKPHHGSSENNSGSTQHQLNEKERTDNYRHAVKSRPTTRMATAGATTNQTRASSRTDQTSHSRTTQGHIQEQATTGREKYRELELKKKSSGDYVPHRQKPSESRRRREEEDDRKLEKLRSIYDSSSRKNKATPAKQPSRGPSRLHSRCGNRRMMSRPVTRLASWEQTTKTSGENKPKVSPSRPVTQAGQSRSKGRDDGQASPTRTSVKEMLDLERRLDESCCWNEIPVKIQFHSKTNNPGQKSLNSKTGIGTETLDFDLNDIMLRAKHKSQGGVAMVTVRLRKQRNQHNRHAQAQYHTIHPSNY